MRSMVVLASGSSLTVGACATFISFRWATPTHVFMGVVCLSVCLSLCVCVMVTSLLVLVSPTGACASELQVELIAIRTQDVVATAAQCVLK